MKCILSLAEAEAINLNSHYLALKWFQTLVKITRLHGSLDIPLRMRKIFLICLKISSKVVRLLLFPTLSATFSR